MREIHFNIAFIVATIGLIAYLIIDGNVQQSSVVGMLGGIGFNVALLLGIGFGLQKFQLGTKRDIQIEIFDNNNIAASIYQAALWIALAIVIAKGIM